MAKSSTKSSAASKALTGPEVMAQMAAAPNLDRFFINKPNFTDDELREFVAGQRAERAIWETKQK